MLSELFKVNTIIQLNPSFSPATIAAFSKFNESEREMLRSINVSLALNPETRPPVQIVEKFADTPVLWVSCMPKTLPAGVKSGNCWMEAHTDADEMVSIWRTHHINDNFNGSLDAFKTAYPKAGLPEFHVTILFGHNPAALAAKHAAVSLIPRKPFRFTRVRALGPPGKEHCFAAVTEDAAVVHWMTTLRDSHALNTNHASYYGSWPVAGGSFNEVIAHGTLANNMELTPEQVANPPGLGVLASIDVRFTCVVEWVTAIIGEKKIKFAQYYPLLDEGLTEVESGLLKKPCSDE